MWTVRSSKGKWRWIIPIICCLIFSFPIIKGIESNKDEQIQDNSQVSTSDVIQSQLIGTWYCSKCNSCNDMDIVLYITQSGTRLCFSRNMISDSGIGGSLIEGDAKVVSADCIYWESTYGDYSLTKEGYLKEYFGRNDRWNIYTKDEFYTTDLPGNYRSMN